MKEIVKAAETPEAFQHFIKDKVEADPEPFRHAIEAQVEGASPTTSAIPTNLASDPKIKEIVKAAETPEAFQHFIKDKVELDPEPFRHAIEAQVEGAPQTESATPTNLASD